MEFEYEESFDPFTSTYRRIYNLDEIKMFFLSEFSDKDRRIIKYSIDVEKPNDSHYVIDSVNISKLAEIMICKNQTNELIHVIRKLIQNLGETGFVRYLEDNGIDFEQFHFDYY